MSKNKSLLICLIILFILGCKNEKKQNLIALSNEKQNEVNVYLKKQVQNTLGLAVAIVKEGQVIYENYLGKEDLNGKPVRKETIFPLYSLSKLITSTAVFQLVEQGKINLDDKLSLYIDKLPAKWGDIEVKNLLTHSSGLPDYNLMQGEVSDSKTMKVLIQNELRFKTGERWEYNQTNYWFLTKIIEKITGKSYESYVIENQFSNHNILFSSNFIDPIPNRSFKYTFNNDSKKWEKISLNFGKRANSAGGINLTLNEFIEWTQKFDKNKLINPNTKIKLWTPFEYEKPFYYEDEQDRFLYGWQQYSSNNAVSYGYTGGLVTGYRKFIDQNMTIIVLSNGLKDNPIHNNIINKIAGIIDENLIESR
ncbi:CubicO group peptidase, beta-lactamase class C family [Marivirga sericea]|uniref:CubicO group peptidase, beta-lactamase class C family n=1 Tax=Marivirga sericea TaxID=1028 RepID=A0A1X7JLT8_9BACT|nr:serine hydrolase domain-containing protein [Marivirga sericea]SMG28920.1 CubicO group peptidase, beta-lactamase class C family [Marivirga sericea]